MPYPLMRRNPSAVGGVADHDHTTADASGVLTNDEHDGFIEIAEIAAPTTPAADKGRIYAFDRYGRTVIRYKTPGGNIFQFHQDNVLVMRNETGGVIGPFTVVYESGTGAGGEPLMAKAKADADATMPALGITVESIADTTNGFVMMAGVITDVNTLAFSVGDILYVSPTVAGAFTVTPPAHPALRQRIARILSDDALGTALVLARQETGNHLGTNQDSWLVGSNTAGNKDVVFRNGNDLDPTSQPRRGADRDHPR